MKKKLLVLILAAMITASLAACSDGDVIKKTGTDSTGASVTQTAATEAATQKATQTNSSAAEVVTTVNTYANGELNGSEIFTDRDLSQTTDLSEAKSYTVADNTDITIDSAGVYVFTGTAKEMSIIVDAASEDKVQIVLNGVDITNTSKPAIYVKSADKVFVTTASGSDNTVSVTGAFTSDGDTNTDAAIFSKDDLVLNGLGALTVYSSENGVSSKDDLKITGGTITVDCAADGFEANDSIAVADGKITVNTDKDAFHAENDEDNTAGYIYICGGTFDIIAGGDGVQATTVLQIDGGTMNINATEGLEGTFVQLNGGDINITASDDGVNATSKSTAYNVKIEINDGNLTVNMGQGDTDGIDSNGDLIINGGTVNVNGQSPFDFDGQGQLNGGTVYTNGSQITELSNQFGMGGGMGGRGGMGGGMGDPGAMPGGFQR